MVYRLSTLALALTSAALPALSQEVNVYSHRQPELIQPLIDAFTAQSGITVNIAFVDKGMVERLVAEGNRTPADLVLIDTGEPFVVDAEKLHSRARNTAFEGRKFQGRARATYVGGECVFDAR